MLFRSAVSTGFDLLGLDYSPIRGPEGNIEYLMWLGKEMGEAVPKIDPDSALIRDLVDRAHGELDK